MGPMSYIKLVIASTLVIMAGWLIQKLCLYVGFTGLIGEISYWLVLIAIGVCLIYIWDKIKDKRSES
ncbi:hypothetical protein [Pediococcus pentosaceus]|uniref:hypothetical protein n=1 Tax=Pediococcus pentosaceus TaxID=1255 RepID=UPI0039822D69